VSARLATGTLVTIDNQIDVGTGTVKLKARFDNEDEALFPNQFVNAHIKVATLQGALLAPTAAVQRGQRDYYVYVVDKDNTVHLRPVTLGPADNAVTVLQDGVEEGMLVVTDGVDRLRDGVRVDVTGR
jgi:multidrug efflux system membrane fusion protein